MRTANARYKIARTHFTYYVRCICALLCVADNTTVIFVCHKHRCVSYDDITQFRTCMALTNASQRRSVGKSMRNWNVRTSLRVQVLVRKQHDDDCGPFARANCPVSAGGLTNRTNKRVRFVALGSANNLSVTRSLLDFAQTTKCFSHRCKRRRHRRLCRCPCKDD